MNPIRNILLSKSRVFRERKPSPAATARADAGATKFVSQGDRARDAGDWARAAEFYAAAIAAVPDDAAIHVQCGHMNKELGRFDAAEAHYIQAKRHMPDDGDLMLQFGHLYKVTKRLDEAVTAYERAAVLLCNRSDVLKELAASREVKDRCSAELQTRNLSDLLHNSFDRDLYLQANPDVQKLGMDPMEHFLRYGWREGRAVVSGNDAIKPAPVAAAGAYPAAREVRDRKPARQMREQIRSLLQESFNGERYLQANPDVRQSGMDPMEHYLRYGWKEGRAVDESMSDVEITDAIWRDGLGVA